MEDQAALHRIIQELGPLLNPVQPSEERSRAQAVYNAAERRHSNELNPVRKRALVRELARCEGHLEDIEKQEKVKAELLQEQLHRLLSKRHGEFTPSVQQRSEQPDEDATLATPDTTTTGIETGLDHDRGISPASKSPINFTNPFEDSVRAGHHSTAPPGDDIQAPDIRETIEPTTERTYTPANVDEQDGVEQTGGSSGSNKRRCNTSASRRAKHQRQAIATGPLTKNTIMFNEVYKDGQVDRRCRIMERDGCYYIFKCKKHDRLFDGNDPLQSATMHLKSHGKLRSTHDNAFEYLGSQVLNCTEINCAENNRAVDRYLEEQEHKRERRKASAYNLERYPRTGETYMAWWDVDGVVMLHALLVIPFSEPGYGVDICVENSELGDDIPACYKSNGDWAVGYKYGGKHVENRMYPIMCFDGNNPHLVDWLPMIHFRLLDVDDQHLDYAQDVKNYIASRRNVSSVEGKRTGTTTEIRESRPQRDVKVETSTQPSGRDQLWPMARRGPPAMESLVNSDSE
ncbi:hypothetical protein FSST1_009752 [Fusarium sambucinum]